MLDQTTGKRLRKGISADELQLCVCGGDGGGGGAVRGIGGWQSVFLYLCATCLFQFSVCVCVCFKNEGIREIIDET